MRVASDGDYHMSELILTGLLALVAGGVGVNAATSNSAETKAACCCGDECNCEECGCCDGCQDGQCGDCEDCTCEGCECCDGCGDAGVLATSATVGAAAEAKADCCCGDQCNCEECGCCEGCQDGQCGDCEDCTCEGCECCDGCGDKA